MELGQINGLSMKFRDYLYNKNLDEYAGEDNKMPFSRNQMPDHSLALRIAKAAESNAYYVNRIGSCYRQVANTLDKFGIDLSGRPAYVEAPQLVSNKNFQEVSTEQLDRGTVIVLGPSKKHPYGHITVYLENGRQASDHVQTLVNSKSYSSVRAFRPR